MKNNKIMDVFTIQNNINLAINASKQLGIKAIGVSAKHFVDKVPHLVLTIMWQLLRLAASGSIDLKHCNEIFNLKEEGEEDAAFLKLKPEEILIRWINWHLKKK